MSGKLLIVDPSTLVINDEDMQISVQPLDFFESMKPSRKQASSKKYKDKKIKKSFAWDDCDD